jgi:23S rRNA (cytidine1920-2'-O)/16S rRNA (cytidine1409-2'-O)-methyltransferase
MRVDLLLVQRGVASTRSAAQRLLDAQGVQWRGAGSCDWLTPKKSGDQVPDDCELQVVDPSETRYVSRGGLKLAGAIAHTGWQAAGLCCLDVGQSTGGFTDCLLQAGAAGVLGLDVGQGQLHARLRDHPGVVVLEQCNAREVSPAQAIEAMQSRGGSAADYWIARSNAGFSNGHGFDAMVGDLSFISQVKVWPAVLPLLRPNADVLMLVKPQFELQPADIGKGGLVKDPSAYDRVRADLHSAARLHGLRWLDFFESPIKGGDGNREFFMWAKRMEPQK